MERSAIRDQPHRHIPHCASLHAGYLLEYPGLDNKHIDLKP